MSRKIPQDAFSYCVALGHERSYQKVADHYGTDKRTITRHAVKGRWSERLAEVEHKAREESPRTTPSRSCAR